jgi:acetyl-CoA synthetase (ADP-forming)/acetyltransferase
MLNTMKALDKDERIDVIIPYFSVEYIMHSEYLLQVKNNADTILDMAKQIKKPVIPILSSFVEDNLDVERTRISTFATLRKAGFPVYSRMQDAVYSIETYFEWAVKQSPMKKG